MSCETNTQGECPLHSDIISAINDPYMDQIINGTKTYEFRKYKLTSEVKRIWFYRTSPYSSISHICEILPARTRNPGDLPLEEEGFGNVEFNTRHEDWDMFDFAYKIVSVYELLQPILLEDLKRNHGFKAAPRGMMYLPRAVGDAYQWKMRKLILGEAKQHS
ncbi:hypothetical protein N7490_005754 [Penicillium lividum]|nr:hypothetical protein N7490_005754 [Penicillium lividum]